MNAAYVAHGVTLALAWFAVVNLALCAGVALIAALSRGRDIRMPAFWLTLRLLPAAAAAAFVLVLFVPSYWQYEPREMVEGFDLTLALLAVAAVALVAWASARAVVAWRRVAQRSDSWIHRATPLTLEPEVRGVRAFAIDAEQPMIALVGIFRPRLLVTRGLLKVLTPAEMAATVAHELSHRRALDNLKRLAICAAPDLLAHLGAASILERKWAAAAELAADRHAGRDGASARCALASALVKVARFTPEEPRCSEPICTLIGGGEIASRVQALLSDRQPTEDRSALRVLCGAAALAVLALTAAYAPLLRIVHEATELLVHTLP